MRPNPAGQWTDIGRMYLSAGVVAVTVGVPLKPPLLATMKSNNYLLNALVAMHAERKGAQLGVQTENGWITESAYVLLEASTQFKTTSGRPTLGHTI
jgi:hypothetical protein